MQQTKTKVYELKIKTYILQDIPYPQTMRTIAGFIDSSLAKREDLLELHNQNQFKQYCFSGFYPLETNGVYQADHIYTVTLRTVDAKLAEYFLKVLKDHITPKMKGLTAEIRIVPKKIIGEIYSLLPVIMKSDGGYWRNTMELEEYERRLFENAVKKYQAYIGEGIEEDFQLYTGIRFMNKKPIGVDYKEIRLLGDKLNLQIADNEMAQELAYFLLGTGIGEMNSRGYGYCNFRWI